MYSVLEGNRHELVTIFAGGTLLTLCSTFKPIKNVFNKRFDFYVCDSIIFSSNIGYVFSVNCSNSKSKLIKEFLYLYPIYLGIQVAELAIDGLHTIDSYLNHTEGIGPNNLTDFSVCLRFNVNYLKPELSTLLSYSTFLSDNTLIITLLKETGGSLLLVCSKCYNCKLEQVSISTLLG